MKTWKKSTIVLVSIATLLLSAIPASAAVVTDVTGDVHHWVVSGGVGSWETATVEKQNIDITEVSYTVNNNNITLTLKVAGVIQDSPNIVYVVYYNSTEAHYWMMYTNGSGGGIGAAIEGDIVYPGIVTNSSNTINGEFQLIGSDTSNVALWGYAAEYTDLNDKSQEWWVDYTPDSYFHGESNGETTDTQLPSQVNGLTVINARDGKLNLSWDTATDNVAVDHYKIYRDNVFLLNRTTTSYQDTGLTNDVTYAYQVSAVDTSGNEGTKSDPGSGTPTASGGGETDTQLPSQVNGLTVINARDGKLNLSWDTATDNVAVDYYKIYRDDILVHNSTTTSYQDTDLTNNQSYTYQISAVDTSGNEGERSEQISGTPTPAVNGQEPNNKKTPGFEAIVLGAALVITINLLRRKKIK